MHFTNLLAGKKMCVFATGLAASVSYQNLKCLFLHMRDLRSFFLQNINDRLHIMSLKYHHPGLFVQASFFELLYSNIVITLL